MQLILQWFYLVSMFCGCNLYSSKYGIDWDFNSTYSSYTIPCILHVYKGLDVITSSIIFGKCLIPPLLQMYIAYQDVHTAKPM